MRGQKTRTLRNLSIFVLAVFAGVAANFLTMNNATVGASPKFLTSVDHDATLTGDGTGAAPLGIANGGVGSAQLANASITRTKMASGQVVTSLNGLTDNVSLSAGSNITITPTGNTLTIAATRGPAIDSRRAALDQWSMPAFAPNTGKLSVGAQPTHVKCDGADLWVTNTLDATVSRVRASDQKLLETWSGAGRALGVLVARSRIYITGNSLVGKLYVIDPSMPAGAVMELATVGVTPDGITTDGISIWVANTGSGISKVDPDSGVVTNVSSLVNPIGLLFDGSNVWATQDTDNTLNRLDSAGSVTQSIQTGGSPKHAVFDGMNILVPCASNNEVTVVRVRDSAGNPLGNAFVLARLTGNGLNVPIQAAFDGQRILVTNAGGDTVSLWNAADLTPLGMFSSGAGSHPVGVCSDGLNFWITLQFTNQLARF